MLVESVLTMSLHDLTSDRVTEYLRALPMRLDPATWQMRPAVDALGFLLVDLLGA
jgi:hypothetical protein